MQKQCLELADQKIALIEQSEQALDSHLSNLSSQISAAQEMLDAKAKSGDEYSNGASSVDLLPEVSGSIAVIFLTFHRAEGKGNGREKRRAEVQKVCRISHI